MPEELQEFIDSLYDKGKEYRDELTKKRRIKQGVAAGIIALVILIFAYACQDGDSTDPVETPTVQEVEPTEVPAEPTEVPAEPTVEPTPVESECPHRPYPMIEDVRPGVWNPDDWDLDAIIACLFENWDPSA